MTKALNLYLLSQTENSYYDTYDAIVVAAVDEASAKLIHPYGADVSRWKDRCNSWATSPENVTAKLLGRAKPGTKPGIILASFNAG